MPSSDSVWALIAASTAASLVSRVVFWSARTPLIRSSFPSMPSERLSMAVHSLPASSSSLRVWLPTAARRRSSLPSSDSVWALIAASMAASLVSRVAFWSARTPLIRSSFTSMDSVWALSAASRATSLVSRVVLTEPRTSRMACSLACWSELILSMASASFAMASSFLRAPLSMASTTLVKSLTTDTLIV